MDALLGPVGPAVPKEVYVTPETYAAYIRESETFRADRTRDAERERDKARWMAIAALAVGLGGVTVAGVVSFRSHPQGWIMAYDSATGHVGIVQRIDQTTLPPAVDNWFLTRYVEMREGFSEASADSDFAAVACMSDLDEQKRFATWFNNDKLAPQQIFARARNHGFRVAKATADPVAVGIGQDGAQRIQVRFEYRDQINSDVVPRPVPGIATFTVQRDRKTPCNPAGLIVSQYERSIERSVTP